MSSSKRILFSSSVVLIVFLVSACGNLPSNGLYNPTVTSAPTLMPVLPTVTPTSTLEFVPVTEFPTRLPTSQPPPIRTPDAIQLDRWQEYQTELAKVLLYGYDIDPSK